MAFYFHAIFMITSHPPVRISFLSVVSCWPFDTKPLPAVKFQIKEPLELKYLMDKSWKMNMSTYWNISNLLEVNLDNAAFYFLEKDLIGIKLYFRKPALCQTLMEKQYIDIWIDLRLIWFFICLNQQNSLYMLVLSGTGLIFGRRIGQNYLKTQCSINWQSLGFFYNLL